MATLVSPNSRQSDFKNKNLSCDAESMPLP